MKRVCLITGGSGKLGAALCESLLGDYECVVVYRSRVPAFASNLSVPLDLRSGPVQRQNEALAHCIQADLTIESERRRVIEVALARFQHIDVVINSAADSRFHGKLLELSLGHDSSVHQVFLNCVIPIDLVSRIFQASWKNDRSGNSTFNRCVINVSSVSGLYVYPNRGQAFYGASKAALNHLTRYLAGELEPYGIRANAVCPSRFPDSVPTESVVSEIRRLMDGTKTGGVIEITGRSAARKPAP